jgi:hypothetical protein
MLDFSSFISFARQVLYHFGYYAPAPFALVCFLCRILCFCRAGQGSLTHVQRGYIAEARARGSQVNCLWCPKERWVGWKYVMETSLPPQRILLSGMLEAQLLVADDQIKGYVCTITLRSWDVWWILRLTF